VYIQHDDLESAQEEFNDEMNMLINQFGNVQWVNVASIEAMEEDE
jgi:hypothetical protein